MIAEPEQGREAAQQGILARVALPVRQDDRPQRLDHCPAVGLREPRLDDPREAHEVGRRRLIDLPGVTQRRRRRRIEPEHGAEQGRHQRPLLGIVVPVDMGRLHEEGGDGALRRGHTCTRSVIMLEKFSKRVEHAPDIGGAASRHQPASAPAMPRPEASLSSMTLIGLYLVTLVVFLAIDVIWLKAVALPLFERHIGGIMREKPDLTVAGLFYAVYVAGAVYFAAAPGLDAGSPGLALLNGFILGLLAYGTYETTNMATLRGWAWPMVISDTLWGGVLTGVSAAIAVWVMG